MRIHLVLTILVKSCWTQIAIKGPNRGFGASAIGSSSSAIGLEQQQSNLLSRSRRFAIPAGSGTTLATDLEFKLTVPIEGLDTSLAISLPFSYSLSLGRYVHCTILDILFSSNHNIHKSWISHCFWPSDPLIDRFY